MQAQTIWKLMLAVGLAAAWSGAQAAEAAAGFTVFAQDYPALPNFSQIDGGGRSSAPPIVIDSKTATVGNSSAHVEVDINGLTGTLRSRFSATVAADRFYPGRNAAASGSMALSGGIDLVGTAPGMATFSAVLEGSYNIFGGDFSSGDEIRSNYTFRVGDSPEFQGNLFYNCCSTGTFSVPFTWTQLVEDGDRIDFNLFLRTVATAGAGSTEFDAGNTFKITAIDLPTGFTFRPDGQGFLSEFGSPVPEPSSGLLAGLGLLVLTLTRFRLRLAPPAR
jgi:hypothetical protein